MQRFKNLEFNLIIFVPLLYIFSYTLADILLVFTALIFLLNFFFYKKKYIFPYLYQLTIIWIFLVITSLIGVNIEYSLSRTIFFFRFLIFFYILVNLNDTKLKNFIYFNSLIIFILSLSVILLALKNIFLFTVFDDALKIKNNGLFNTNELVAGNFIIKFIFIYLLFLIMFKKLDKNQFIYFSFVSLSLISVLFTFNDTSKILSIFSIILLISFFLYMKEKFYLLILFCIVVILLSIIFVILNFEEIKYLFFWSGYLNKWHAAFIIFLDNPYFGIGVRNYRFECRLEQYQILWYNFTGSFADPCSTHPHNIYLEILSETGIFGFILILVFFLRLILDKIIYSDFKKIEKFFIILCLFNLINPLTSTASFFSTNGSIIYWLLFGLIVRFRNVKKYD